MSWACVRPGIVLFLFMGGRELTTWDTPSYVKATWEEKSDGEWRKTKHVAVR